MRAAFAVVVSYRSENSIQELLDSIARTTANVRGELKVVVVDTSASKVMATLVRGSIPGAEAVICDRNLGFARAVNLGVEVLTAKFGAPSTVVLINPDVEMHPAVLDGCLAHMKVNLDVGVASPRLVDQHGNQDRGCGRRDWNHRRLLAEVVGSPNLARVMFSSPRLVSIPEGESRDTDLVSGAFMLVRPDVFDQGLDETLPMYLEDQEICIRARKRGARVTVFGDITALHRGGESRRAVGGDLALTRVLRCMELADAPVRALAIAGKGTIWSGRLTVAIGAVARHSIASVFRLSNRHKRWAQEQQTLARWMMTWSWSPLVSSRGADLQTVFEMNGAR